MQGYELRVRCCALRDINYRDIHYAIGKLVNFSMGKCDYLKRLHKSDGLKGYCFSGLIPYEKDFYREGEIYDFYIRSLEKTTISEFRMVLTGLENQDFLVLDTEFIVTEHKEVIESIDTVTPMVITIGKEGRTSSWNTEDGLDILEDNIVKNLNRKFNYINNTNLRASKEDIVKSVSVTSKCPIVINYKSSSRGILGYRVRIKFKENIVAQEMAKVSYFLGVATKNSSLGCGFTRVTYRRK